MSAGWAMNVDLSGNPRRFIAFTVFYTARAYYPVLAILFLDLGLTLDQFVLLNLIWAATIFLFEVPSGALADTIGRRKLLITASILMVLEMLCLLFAPRDGGVTLMLLCVLNRIFSGLSEACASGADEALAYDSLPPDGRENRWDQLLATSMRWRSAGFVIAMILGGILYDPTIINRLTGPGVRISDDLIHRLPVLLVLGQALVCVGVTWRMVETPLEHSNTVQNRLKDAVSLTVKTARWVFTNPHTLVIVVTGLVIDSVVRNFATITSSYYRLIELPEWSYGLIGASFGALGWFVPSIAQRLNARYTTLTNLGIAAVVSLAALAALVPAWPLFGLIPAMFLMTTLGFLGFTVSKALHREAESGQRATVLSVKGLAFNLGYGLYSLAFSRLLAGLDQDGRHEALQPALFFQVPVFAILIIILFCWAKPVWRRVAMD